MDALNDKGVDLVANHVAVDAQGRGSQDDAAPEHQTDVDPDMTGIPMKQVDDEIYIA